jgi:HNH endonuclease
MSENVEVGKWVDVPPNMVAAPDTYIDSEGVLRSFGDNSCVVWHNPGCTRRGIQPYEIIYNENKAPWCPHCWTTNQIKLSVSKDVKVNWCGLEFFRWHATSNGDAFRDGVKVVPWVNKRGHSETSDRGRLIAIHTLVLNAFIGPCPPGLEGCHWDDDGTNNKLENLRWDTHSANVLDSVRNGTHARLSGEENGSAFLTQKEVDKIREEFKTTDISQRALGRKYNVSHRTIGRIIRNEAWK